MKTHLDWSAYDTYGIGDAFAGIPMKGGSYAKAVAVCMHNRECQRTGKGVMCPSFRTTHDPAHSTEARVAAFKAALNGELGDTPFTHPALAAALDWCVLCKGCKKECPSAVDMTLIKTEFTAQRNDVVGVSLRQRLLGGLPAWVGRWGHWVRPLVLWRNGSRLGRHLAERWLGLSARRRIPAPTATPFAPPRAVATTGKRVILFVDTFAWHFDPDIAEATRFVLETAGYAVEIARPAPDDREPDRSLCCGRTYLSTGQVDKARAEAQRVLAALRPALADATPVIGLEPSCTLSMRDEFYSLGLGEEVGRLGKQIFLLEEFLLREANRGLTLPLAPITPSRALVHGHCHQKAFGAMKSLRKVLSWIPDFQFEVIDASCCGMAGAFGLEAEHYDASQDMAELALLPAIRAADDRTTIVADGFSCRHQIEDGTGRKPVHVAILLRQALSSRDRKRD